jgi:hypothetical protein
MLHDDVVATRGIDADVEDLDDVLVHDLARGARLLAKPCALVARDLGIGDELDRDRLAKPDVLRLVDLAHATTAERARDQVATVDRLAHELVVARSVVVGDDRPAVERAERFAAGVRGMAHRAASLDGSSCAHAAMVTRFRRCARRGCVVGSGYKLSLRLVCQRHPNPGATRSWRRHAGCSSSARMTNRCSILLLLAACPAAPPRQETPRQQPQQPVHTVVEYEEHGVIAPIGTIPTLDQPPHVKLKLGHFRNDQFNIGLTVDLLSDATDSVADLDPALVRFDGDAKLWRLEGRHGGSGRVDYVRERGRVMLEVESNGRMRVYVIDPETDLAGEPIDLYRDADAEPLKTQPKGNP